MATERTAEVEWHGDLMGGGGRIESVTSGAVGGLDVDWRARSEEAGSKPCQRSPIDRPRTPRPEPPIAPVLKRHFALANVAVDPTPTARARECRTLHDTS